MYPALLTALIVSVTGRYNISLEGKIKNTNCYISQKTVELLSDVQSLQKFSIKKLNQLSFRILFKDCKEHKLFLFCPNKKYLPISFFPFKKLIFIWASLQILLPTSSFWISLEVIPRSFFENLLNFFMKAWMCQSTKKSYSLAQSLKV